MSVVKATSTGRKIDLNMMIHRSEKGRSSSVRCVCHPVRTASRVWQSRLCHEESLVVDTLKVLGKGNYGIVYDGSIGDRKAAIKVFTDKSNSAEDMDVEWRIHEKLDHASIVAMFARIECPALSGLFMEQMAGSLEDFLVTSKDSTLTENLEWLRDISKALCYLHKEQCLVYRDLRAANILFTEEKKTKLSDFSLALPIGSISKEYDNLCYYVAPEANRTKVFNTDGIEVSASADSFGLAHLADMLCNEKHNLPYAWDQQVGRLVSRYEFDYSGTRPCHTMTGAFLPPLEYPLRAQSPFLKRGVRTMFQERFIKPALKVKPEERITPEQFLDAVERELEVVRN